MNPDIAAQLIKRALTTTADDNTRLAQIQIYADNLAHALNAIGLLAYATGPQERQGGGLPSNEPHPNADPTLVSPARGTDDLAEAERKALNQARDVAAAEGRIPWAQTRTR